jgi:hypothetical protein
MSYFVIINKIIYSVASQTDFNKNLYLSIDIVHKKHIYIYLCLWRQLRNILITPWYLRLVVDFIVHRFVVIIFFVDQLKMMKKSEEKEKSCALSHQFIMVQLDPRFRHWLALNEKTRRIRDIIWRAASLSLGQSVSQFHSVESLMMARKNLVFFAQSFRRSNRQWKS